MDNARIVAGTVKNALTTRERSSFLVSFFSLFLFLFQCHQRKRIPVGVWIWIGIRMKTELCNKSFGDRLMPTAIIFCRSSSLYRNSNSFLFSSRSSNPWRNWLLKVSAGFNRYLQFSGTSVVGGGVSSASSSFSGRYGQVILVKSQKTCSRDAYPLTTNAL